MAGVWFTEVLLLAWRGLVQGGFVVGMAGGLAQGGFAVGMAGVWFKEVLLLEL
jgi:hypothetical protein